MTISSDTNAPFIVVIGATGAQGGSVIKALAESDKPYRIRGITRDPSKPAGQDLKKQGVEPYKATIAVGQENEIREAFKGAKIVFAVTDFWQHTNKEKEIAEGKLVVDAAKAAGVELFIWSGLVDIAVASKGKYKNVDHFDSKAAVTKHAHDVGLPTINVMAGCYMSNFTSLTKFQKQADGSLKLSIPCRPDTPFHLIDTNHDYGLYVRQAIESSEFKPGDEILATSETLTPAEIAKIVGEAFGVKATFEEVSKEGFLQFGMPEQIAIELYEMFQSFQDPGYYGGKDAAPSQKHLGRKPRKFAEFVKANGQAAFA